MTLRMYGIENLPRPLKDSNALKEGGIQTVDNTLDNKPRILIMGDSHALMWSSVMDEIAQEMEIPIFFFGMDAKFPFIRNFSLDKPSRETLDGLYDYKRVESIVNQNCIVFIIARWSWSWRHYEYANSMISFIERNNSYTVLIEQPPELFFGDRNTPQYLSF